MSRREIYILILIRTLDLKTTSVYLKSGLQLSRCPKRPGLEEEERERRGKRERESENVTQVVVVVVGGTVNLWGRNSDKWFTSRRWHHRLAPTPRRRAFSVRSHLPFARNEINWVYRGGDVSLLPPVCGRRCTDLPVTLPTLYGLASFPRVTPVR